MVAVLACQMIDMQEVRRREEADRAPNPISRYTGEFLYRRVAHARPVRRVIAARNNGVIEFQGIQFGDLPKVHVVECRDSRLPIEAACGEFAPALRRVEARKPVKAYKTKGEGELASRKLAKYLSARYGSVGESKDKLGELATVRDAFKRKQVALYDDTART